MFLDKLYIQHSYHMHWNFIPQTKNMLYFNCKLLVPYTVIDHQYSFKISNSSRASENCTPRGEGILLQKECDKSLFHVIRRIQYN